MTPLERTSQVEELWVRRKLFADAMNEARLTNFRGRWLGFYGAGDVARVAPVMVWKKRRRQPMALVARLDPLPGWCA